MCFNRKILLMSSPISQVASRGFGASIEEAAKFAAAFLPVFILAYLLLP
jgi:hypothetical protein